MKIQDSVNKTIRDVAIISSLNNISKELKKEGFTSIDNLDMAIKKLEVEIAVSRDRGEDCSHKQALYENYTILRKKYYDEIEKEKKKRKKLTIIGTIIAIVFLAIFYAVVFGVLI